VKSNQSAVACEMCSKWYHIKCVGITAEGYKFLKTCSVEASNDSGPSNTGGVMWFCPDCMGQATQIVKNISAIQKRQEDMEQRMNSIELEVKENKRAFESRLNDNDKEMKEMHKEILNMNAKLQMVQDDIATDSGNLKWTDIVNKAVDSKLETVSADINMVEQSIEETRVKAQEIRDKEDRKNNIILYKIPESQAGIGYEAVVKHDSDLFLAMCDEVFGLDITREDVKKIHRIGRRGPATRPLLIQLSSGMLKNNIMETTYKLQKADNYKHIIISHDMTRMEREQCKRLVEEAKDRETQEASGEFIYRVRGPPGGMKVVRLKKRM